MMAKCNRECHVFSRVVGYLTPVDDWHIGKKSEFVDRVPFDGDKAMKRIDDEAESDEAGKGTTAEGQAAEADDTRD